MGAVPASGVGGAVAASGRRTIERTMARLTGCRRLHRRCERKAEHFLALTSIACTLICYRKLAK